MDIFNLMPVTELIYSKKGIELAENEVKVPKTEEYHELSTSYIDPLSIKCITIAKDYQGFCNLYMQSHSMIIKGDPREIAETCNYFCRHNQLPTPNTVQ